MTSVLFSAVGRGYSARSILNSIGRKFPSHANTISNAYYAGYTAEQILSRIASKKDKKNYDPEDFMTDHEKTRNRDDKQKSQALMKAVAAIGASGAITAGAYQLYKRNLPVRPEILPALSQQKKISAPKQQLALPAPGSLRQSPQQPSQQPQAPMMPPMGMQQANQGQPSPQMPQQNQMPNEVPQRNIQKSVDLVKNLREDSRFENIIGAGYDEDTTALILRKTVPKELLYTIDQSEGGLKQVMNDYKQFMTQAKQQQIDQQQSNFQAPMNTPPERSELKESVTPTEIMNNDVLKQSVSKQQIPQNQPSLQQEMGTIRQQESAVPLQATKKLGMTSNGKIGEVESVKNNVATMKIDGATRKEKENSIVQEPEGIETAVREIINSIPEGMKSTALQSMVHIPGSDLLLTQFYDGKWAWYMGVPEETYRSIALGTYEPKGQGTTGIAEYKPGVADSRGAGFHTEIKMNPNFSKENKGKTWGYATNEYSLLKNIQGILHKISKEKYDESGKLVHPKAKKNRR